MKFFGSAASEEKSFENVNGWTDTQMDGRTDDGRKVITIAHPDHSSGELKSMGIIKMCIGCYNTRFCTKS